MNDGKYKIYATDKLWWEILWEYMFPSFDLFHIAIEWLEKNWDLNIFKEKESIKQRFIERISKL